MCGRCSFAYLRMFVQPLGEPSANEGAEETDEVPQGDAAVDTFDATGKDQGDAHAAEDATDSFSTHIVFQLNIVSRFCGKLGASEGPLPSVRLIVSGLPRAVGYL